MEQTNKCIRVNKFGEMKRTQLGSSLRYLLCATGEFKGKKKKSRTRAVAVENDRDGECSRVFTCRNQRPLDSASAVYVHKSPTVRFNSPYQATLHTKCECGNGKGDKNSIK